ncbi:hypothetical protein MP638_000201 [Amoeboaphelidium occidentale]|nr:hypothetical protein MP638_000201 [Amoeboaphelidium occidentale]
MITVTKAFLYAGFEIVNGYGLQGEAASNYMLLGNIMWFLRRGGSCIVLNDPKKSHNPQKEMLTPGIEPGLQQPQC